FHALNRRIADVRTRIRYAVETFALVAAAPRADDRFAVKDVAAFEVVTADAVARRAALARRAHAMRHGLRDRAIDHFDHAMAAHARFQRDRLIEIHAVVVEMVAERVGAVGNRADRSARFALGVIQKIRKIALEPRDTVARDEIVHAAFGDAARRDLRLQIAR